MVQTAPVFDEARNRAVRSEPIGCDERPDGCVRGEVDVIEDRDGCGRNEVGVIWEESG